MTITIILSPHQQQRLRLLSLAIRPNRLSLLASPLDGIQGLYRADESKLLLVGLSWYIHV